MSLAKSIMYLMLTAMLVASPLACSKDGPKPATKDEASASPGKVLVVIETSKGNIEVELDGERAPITVANFLRYVDDEFYGGTIFHRVMPGFMIQGGGFRADMSEKSTRAPIENEADNGLKNDRGTIVMALPPGVVDGATVQFFINVVDNDFLNHKDRSVGGFGYAVFGKVVRGMDVADAIVAVPTTRVGGKDDVPVQAVTILRIRRAAAKPAPTTQPAAAS